ncbi:hypothetical protein RSSE_c3032 [Ralstonia solanacearum]|nr:hypothetical protein RSSE_c3032 [Ralstonia solanacearum]
MSSYRETIKPVRNRMRKFEYHSVLLAISQYLLDTDARGAERAKRLPWVAERLAAWALRDEPRLYGHSPMQQKDLLKCMNMAWVGIDALDGWPKKRIPLALLVRQMLLAQVPYQQDRRMGAFARQITLLSRLQPNSRLRQVIERKLGVRAEVYLQLAFLLWLKATEGIHDIFTPKYMNTLAQAFGTDVLQTFLRTVSTPIDVVRRELKNFDDDEWFQPNVLYRFPFVYAPRQLYFWGAPCLHRHIEYAFSDIVANAGDPTAKQAFEDAFEAYVGVTLNRTGSPVLDEQAIKHRFDVRGPCSDFMVIEDTAIVLFEVKNKSLSLDLPASASVKTLQAKLRGTIVKADSQLANVAAHARNIPELAKLPLYRVIVTYGDLMLGQPDYLFGETEGLAEPILILSVDELDSLVEAVRLKRCTMGQFFADFLARRQDPARSLFTPGQLLTQVPYRLDRAPEHLMAIYDAVVDPIMDKLGQLEMQAG